MPRIVNNNGLEVWAGSSAVITTKSLSKLYFATNIVSYKLLYWHLLTEWQIIWTNQIISKISKWEKFEFIVMHPIYSTNLTENTVYCHKMAFNSHLIYRLYFLFYHKVLLYSRFRILPWPHRQNRYYLYLIYM